MSPGDVCFLKEDYWQVSLIPGEKYDPDYVGLTYIGTVLPPYTELLLEHDGAAYTELTEPGWYCRMTYRGEPHVVCTVPERLLATSMEDVAAHEMLR